MKTKCVQSMCFRFTLVPKRVARSSGSICNIFATQCNKFATTTLQGGVCCKMQWRIN